MRTGIALSGGGAQGDFEVGVLRFLHDIGVRPEIVTGTSVGSMHAAAVALGEGGIDLIERTWAGMRSKEDLFVDGSEIASLPSSIKAIVDVIINNGVSTKFSGAAFGASLAAAIYFPFNLGTLIQVGFQVADVIQAIQTIMNMKGLYSYEPIMRQVRQLLADNWLTLDPASRKSVAVARHADGRAEVFVRGLDRMMWRSAQDVPGGTFGPPVPFDKEVTSNAATVLHIDGKLEVIVRGTDRAMWRRKQSLLGGGPTHDAWDAWQVLGPPGWEFASDPAAARDAGGRVMVAARGTNNVLYVCACPAGGAWGDWASLGKSDVTADPFLIMDATGALQVFVRGADGHAYQQKIGLGGWIDLGAPPGGVITSNLAVAQNELGGLELFARGQDAHAGLDPAHLQDFPLWCRRQTNATSAFLPWTSMGGSLAGDPVAGRNQDGRVEVFARFKDNSLRHTWHDGKGGPWTAWYTFGGDWAGDPAVPRDSTALGDGRAGDLLTALCRGADGALWSVSQTAANNGWRGPDAIGGTVWPGIRLRLAMVAMNQGRTRYTDEYGRFTDRIDAPYLPGMKIPDPSKQELYDKITGSAHGETVTLDQAILASSSIPIYFPAMPLFPDFYVDAGISEPMPVQVALQLGAEKVYAVATQAPHVPPSAPAWEPHLKETAFAALSTMVGELLDNNVAPDGPGWDSRVTVIRPTFDVNGAMEIEPGHIRIAIDYGFLRANDVYGPFPPPKTKLPAGGFRGGDVVAAPTLSSIIFSQLTDEIIGLRLGIWWLEELANGWFASSPPPFSSFLPPEAWVDPRTPLDHWPTGLPWLEDPKFPAEMLGRARALKRTLRERCLSRRQAGGVLPRGCNDWWAKWESHYSLPVIIPTPWDAWLTLPQESPPDPLP